MMIRIGLVGEDPNDTIAVTHLMQQKYNEGYQYFPLLKRIRGSNLDNKQFAGTLYTAIKHKKPDFIIVVRDADAIVTEEQKIRDKQSWYQKLSQKFSCDHILLLNIYELEALILSDIASFNPIYKTNIANIGDVSYIVDPKKVLKEKTSKGQKQYHESHCATLFQSLKFDAIKSKCKYFSNFIIDFEKKLGI